nr:hypothetical protein B0A51_01373 [Rachicladosporium sp. CCFEE 5018]
MSSLAAQKATLDKVLALLNAYDLDALAELFTPDFIRFLQPKASVEPHQLNAQQLTFGLKRIGQQFTSPIVYEFHNHVHDAEAHRSVLEFSNHADTTLGPFGGEGVLFFQFTEDGKKISRVDEYVDSIMHCAFQEKLAAAKVGGMH